MIFNAPLPQHRLMHDPVKETRKRTNCEIDAPGYSLYRSDNAAELEFQAINPSDEDYVVNMSRMSCDCPDFFARGHLRPCKHLRLVANLLALAPQLAEPH